MSGNRSTSVVIISATCPAPADNGKRVVLQGFIRFFVARVGPDAVEYVFVAPAGTPAPRLPCRVTMIRKPSGPRQVLDAGWHGIVRRRRSLQEGVLGSPHLTRRLREIIDARQPDLVVWDTLRLAQHARVELERHQVIYLDDLFSRRYARMVASPELLRGIDPLGEFGALLPAPLRPLGRRPVVYRRLLRLERDLIARRERQIVHGFDLSLLVNGDEAAQLRRESGCDRVEVVRPWLPAPTTGQRAPSDPPEFVFLGALNVPHNQAAFTAFVRDHLQELLGRMPRARIRVIGKGASEALRALADRSAGSIVIEGYVEDLDTVFASATAMIVPLLFGSGVKIKVLEALSRGLPVVSTSIGLEGIPADPVGGDGCVVEDRLSQWPALLDGLTDPTENQRMSARARRFYDRVYGDGALEEYDRLFDGLLDSPAVARPARVDRRVALPDGASA